MVRQSKLQSILLGEKPKGMPQRHLTFEQHQFLLLFIPIYHH